MKPKPWRSSAGFLVGLVFGLLLWWGSHDPSRGILENAGLIIVCAAMGIFIVDLRNRRKKVGHYDPQIIAENKRGRV